MAGHSHWAGIKHKKGRADQLRSKISSKTKFLIINTPNNPTGKVLKEMELIEILKIEN